MLKFSWNGGEPTCVSARVLVGGDCPWLNASSAKVDALGRADGAARGKEAPEIHGLDGLIVCGGEETLRLRLRRSTGYAPPPKPIVG